jgi:mannitol-1-phosphate/altronate dehydrogenase
MYTRDFSDIRTCAGVEGNNSYLSWLENNVDFPDEMGDGVVPHLSAVPEIIKQEARKRIGKEDHLITYTEKMPEQRK